MQGLLEGVAGVPLGEGRVALVTLGGGACRDYLGREGCKGYLEGLQGFLGGGGGLQGFL